MLADKQRLRTIVEKSRLRSKSDTVTYENQELGNLKTHLPASAFPKQADVYTCDNCGREVTKHFHPGRAHVWQPMGPETFECRCGRRYATGAKEWQHFSYWERRRRVRETLVLGVLFSAISSCLSLAIYVVFHRSRGTRIIAWVVAALPFVVSNGLFWFQVGSSLFRTTLTSRTHPPEVR